MKKEQNEIELRAKLPGPQQKVKNEISQNQSNFKMNM